MRLIPAAPGHAEALFTITPPDTFVYFLSWPREWKLAAYAEWFEAFCAGPRTRTYIVQDGSGRTLGSTSFMDIDAANRCVEIGATWYAPGSRGTRVNPACKLLMLDHALHRVFVGPGGERTGCVRVTLKCDARNLHSQRAIAKLGAAREGTLRRHRIQPDGFVRDTVYFSILPEEWPRVRAGLEARLAVTA